MQAYYKPEGRKLVLGIGDDSCPETPGDEGHPAANSRSECVECGKLVQFTLREYEDPIDVPPEFEAIVREHQDVVVVE